MIIHKLGLSFLKRMCYNHLMNSEILYRIRHCNPFFAFLPRVMEVI